MKIIENIETMKRHLFHSMMTPASLCSIFYFSAQAQSSDSINSISIIGGAGNYEYLYSGFNFPFATNFYLETAIGIKPWNLKTEFYAMTYVDIGIPLFDSEHQPLLQLYLQPKFFCWYFNNEWNRFIFLGLAPEARLRYPISGRLGLCGTVGVIYNLQLYYERKTYEEVGYPKELQPSFSLQLSYQLK
ncbi:MAG TPA: hypothetical protein VE978_03170 [Chitinophagales bacterium]|nr:hypothetical protein [Chitinophagales bacterium]